MRYKVGDWVRIGSLEKLENIHDRLDDYYKPFCGRRMKVIEIINEDDEYYMKLQNIHGHWPDEEVEPCYIENLLKLIKE